MKIKFAKTAGFCMGVRRAIEMALNLAHHDRDEEIYTYGPLIHNPQVLELLESKGVSVIETEDEIHGGTVVIRAHGISPDERRKLRERSDKLVDATCPRVGRVHAIIKRHAAGGFHTVIVGHADHPEVLGLTGFATAGYTVVCSVEETELIPPTDKICVVAQTTQRRPLFREISEAVALRFPDADIKLHDTICDSTNQRQEEIRKLASTVDTVVVVGGKNSGNTIRLADVARSTGTPTYHVETEEELKPEMLEGVKSLAVTAGASTPNWMILSVIEKAHQIAAGRRSAAYRVWDSLWKNCVKTNLFLALGAGSLSYASTLLQRIEPHLIFSAIAILYIFAMYTIHHTAELTAARYNYPDRADLYERRRRLFTAVSFISGAAAVALSAALGPALFIIFVLITVMGFLYNLKTGPSKLIPGINIPKVGDIPMSKTLLAALGWGAVTAGLPALAEADTISFVTAAAFFYAVSMAFIRAGIFDLLDVQGDRIVGKETLPIMMGEKWAGRFLRALAAAAGAWLLILAAADRLPAGFAVLMLIPLAYLVSCVHMVERRIFSRPLYYELTVDSAFFLAGFLAFISRLVS